MSSFYEDFHQALKASNDRREGSPARRLPVVCPYCGAETTTDPYWMTPRAVLKSHWFGACKRLPWWRRWFR